MMINNPVEGFGRSGKELWSQIKEKCPILTALILDGSRDDPDDPWFEDLGLFHVSIFHVLVCITF
jgi:hypothetical protein